MVNNQESALDLAQDTFFKAIEYLSDAPSPIRNPRAWLFGIARNHCVTILKRTNLERQLVENNSARFNQFQASFEDELLDRFEWYDILAFADRNFSTSEAEVFRLYAGENLSQQEIAQIMGISQSAVSRILIASAERIRDQFRAHKKLGKALALLVLRIIAHG